MVKEINYLGIIRDNKRNCFKKQNKFAIEKAERFNNKLHSILGISCTRMLKDKTFWKGLAMTSYLYAHEVVHFEKEEV